MSREPRTRFSQEYEVAHREFQTIRRQHTRISHCGQEFVLADRVTEGLKKRSATCHNTYDNDLDRLGQTAYLRRNPAPPYMKKEEYHRYLLIFYTLLDVQAPYLIHQFRDSDLNSDSLPIKLEDLRDNIKAPSDFKDFHEKFYETQFSWCPIKLELGMHRKFMHSVSPFSQKVKMEPYRDGAGARDNNAKLYTIEVPEELVGPSLRKKMASAKIERLENIGGRQFKSLRYRFAMKQFESHRYSQFNNETRMLTNLENNEGMIQYIGWFRNYEVDQEGGKKEYWNILLELADFDFYTAIRKESPPISFEEIHGFWNTMSEIAAALASIHEVTLGGKDYLTWHGDIKPENILRVNDSFKLADPGEASMSLKSQDMSRPQRTATFGGTRTYAAPDKEIYWEKNGTKTLQVDQTIDVWSLGCVFSIAATYVVLGTQGVLIYNHLRRQAIHDANGTIGDTFHDGSRVLSQITNWHKYLRETVRKTDAFSAAVLDMVDSHMLVEKGSRWTATEVCSWFTSMFETAGSMDTTVPDVLQEIFLSINDQVELKYEQHSGIKRPDNDDAPKRSKAADSLPDLESEFKSRQQLLEQDILPTAQRSQNRPGSIRQLRRPSSSIGTLSSTATKSQYAAEPSVYPRGASDSRQSVQGHVPATSSNQLLQPPTSPNRKSVTAWTVRKELKKKGMVWNPRLRSFSSFLKSQPTTMKGKTATTPELAALDSKLEREFKNRDIVYLVDNGSSMVNHWEEATHLLEVLVWRSLGYDDNGMELYFTDPDTDPSAKVKESRNQTLKEFTDAMKAAEPQTRRGSEVLTTIQPELERIINQYSRAKASKTEPRKKTIIVLTDGIWKGMHNEFTLDTYLMSTLSSLRDLHGDLAYYERGQSTGPCDIAEIRPVTIQFVQFGDNPRAANRLRRLDDDLKFLGYPDLIDTEGASGDIFKMFLGSLCQDEDLNPRATITHASTNLTSPPNVSELPLRRRSTQETEYLASPMDSTVHHQSLSRALSFNT
ncbi:Serine/threonine-protein kinase mph1 [Colletotrichum viniferum]|nr:Serine/threonine-protein kinase mph1 [Colletotrichum viniferum]